MRDVSANKASLVVFLSAAAWGCYWVPLYFLESLGFTPGWAVALLNLPGALVLTVIFIIVRRKATMVVHRALWIIFFTGMGLALYASGIVLSSVVRATLLFYLTPI